MSKSLSPNTYLLILALLLALPIVGALSLFFWLGRGFALLFGRFSLAPEPPRQRFAPIVRRPRAAARAPLESPGDITSVLSPEEALRQSEEVFKKTFQASQEALMIRRLRDNVVLDVNPAFERVTGYTRQEVFNDPNLFFELLTGPDYSGVVPRLLSSGVPVVNYEVKFRHKRGEIREALVTAEHVEIRGEPCLMVIGRDVTEIRQVERVRLAGEAAEEANKAKSEFLARMSHELRTPLNAVLGFTELMEMDDPTPKQLDSLKHIRRAGQHLLKLVSEVLDIARIEAQQIDLTPEPIAVDGILNECLDLIDPSAQQSDVTVSIIQGSGTRGQGPEDNEQNAEGSSSRPPIPDPWSLAVLADRVKLRQTLLNLISNAVKYNRQGGSVTVGATHNGNGYVRISVSDTGPGIPADQMNRLFRPFERLGVSRRNIEGTGLGLALTKLLVEAMAGRIGVESKEGDGSTFWVEFPRVVLHSTASAEPKSAEQEAGGGSDTMRVTGHVLYIEDNISNLKLVESMLRHRPGIRLSSALTGGEGLESARTNTPDLILLDLNLPDMNGEEVLLRLREVEDLAHVPVVVVSADANPAQIEKLQSLGAHSYITKPVDVQLLLALIDNLLKP